jgi:phosphate transport system ATP-binding protein
VEAVTEDGRPAGAAGVSPALAVEDLRVWYSDQQILKGITLSWPHCSVNALIGPSGCGKTTLLRSLNRLVELAPGSRVEGQILLDGIHIGELPPHEARRRIGMVFQRPNPFPMSIFDNLAYALRDQASFFPRRAALAERVEQLLRTANLWDEVKDELKRTAISLSGGQQQRLCIARVLAANPDVILMDEPCSSLDPRSTAAIEELIDRLRLEYTVIVVTHNLAQAARIADNVAFLYLGELVEQGGSEVMLARPVKQQTQDFVAGLYG